QFDVRRRAFGKRLYAAVIEVLHITDHLMPRGRALRKETIANALHVAADEKSASYHSELHKYSSAFRTQRHLKTRPPPPSVRLNVPSIPFRPANVTDSVIFLPSVQPV